MYQRVVIPLDGSAVAESILPFILDIAEPLEFQVTLVRVVPAAEPAASAAEAGFYLDRIAGQLAGKGVRVRSEVRRGDPVEQILALARDVDADLIAMTTRGHGRLRRVVLGSVADALLRAGDIPMFLFSYVERRAA